MRYFLNSTADYHRHDLTSLGWELTVCNSLEPANSPCRKILSSPLSFGEHLYHFLKDIIPLDEIHNVLEIGGGMGYLMRALLTLNPRMKANMMDISPYLLDRQRETLKGFNADFELADMMTSEPSSLSSFELAILNENIGDFPALVAEQTRENTEGEIELKLFLERLHHFCRTYDLPADRDPNVNIGAMEAVEKLCLAGIPYIYLSEHSCEASVPEDMKPYLHFTPANVPEKIELKGHEEYTVKFSYLQKIAHMLNYKTIRGSFADFLVLQINDKIETALRLSTPMNDEQEIIRQFVYDLYKYEYLILIKGGSQ